MTCHSFYQILNAYNQNVSWVNVHATDIHTSSSCREAYTRFGGPDGGNGGRGGNVVLVADSTLRSLSGLLNNYSAESGARGQSGQSFGRNGKDITLKVNFTYVMPVHMFHTDT